MAEKDEIIIQLQSRVQQLTEDKDLIQKELEVDYSWVNVQDELREKVEELGKEKQELEDELAQIKAE